MNDRRTREKRWFTGRFRELNFFKENCETFAIELTLVYGFLDWLRLQLLKVFIISLFSARKSSIKRRTLIRIYCDANVEMDIFDILVIRT